MFRLGYILVVLTMVDLLKYQVDLFCEPGNNLSSIFYFQIELDNKFGCSWHVVTGEEFGTDITFEVNIGQ